MLSPSTDGTSSNTSMNELSTNFKIDNGDDCDDDKSKLYDDDDNNKDSI